MLYAILLLAILITVIAGSRLKDAPLRRVAGIEALNAALNGTVEAGRTIHVSMGASAIGRDSAASALAVGEIAYQAMLKAALADEAPTVTVSDSLSLVLAQDRLYRALRARSAATRYRGTLARWYPQGSLSMVFAAGVGEAILTDDFAANILAGRFGVELALIAENAVRYDRTLIAQSDLIEGQAVAFAVSESPLIGEELYVSSAYLDRQPLFLGNVAAMDTLRVILILLMLILGVLSGLGVAL